MREIGTKEEGKNIRMRMGIGIGLVRGTCQAWSSFLSTGRMEGNGSQRTAWVRVTVGVGNSQYVFFCRSASCSGVSLDCDLPIMAAARVVTVRSGEGGTRDDGRGERTRGCLGGG